MSVKKDIGTLEGHLEPLNHTADGIAFDNTVSGLTAGNVQDAIDEITTGGVIGPGLSTDNAITRWDGTTGTIIQNSLAILQDGGAIESRGFITNRTVDTVISVGSNQTMISPSLEMASGGVIMLASGANLIII